MARLRLSSEDLPLGASDLRSLPGMNVAQDGQQKNKSRYAAKLLFQFKVSCADWQNKRRLCEERIVTSKSTPGMFISFAVGHSQAA